MCELICSDKKTLDTFNFFLSARFTGSNSSDNLVIYVQHLFEETGLTLKNLVVLVSDDANYYSSLAEKLSIYHIIDISRRL